MSRYEKEWPCCGDTTITNSWEPESCPFCSTALSSPPVLAVEEGRDAKDAARWRFMRDNHFQYFTPTRHWVVTDADGRMRSEGTAESFQHAIDSAMALNAGPHPAEQWRHGDEAMGFAVHDGIAVVHMTPHFEEARAWANDARHEHANNGHRAPNYRIVSLYEIRALAATSTANPPTPSPTVGEDA